MSETLWTPQAIGFLLDEQLGRHPVMEVQDVYKLLYQAVLGPEHLIRDAEEFATRLREEYASLPPGGEEPLWEAIRPDGRLGRLHLRPFRQSGLSVERLVDACLRTAEQPWGSRSELEATWNRFCALCRAGRWNRWSWDEVQAFGQRLERERFPPVHHSPAFCAAERPAYRLVSSSCLAWLGAH
jgi:hypothetical protein